jgi:predicted esterase
MPPSPPVASSDASDAAPDAPMDAPTLRPLDGFFEALPVPGHPDAWLSLPTGATSRRPVVVVLHGAGDRPDWQCGGWRHATGEYPFVVCPRGKIDPQSTKGDIRYTHVGDAPMLLAHIDGALEALAARYPDYVDATTPLLAGFSLGAAQVVTLAVRLPARFPRIALIEGATTSWSDTRVSAYLQSGGQRMLFGCGQGLVRKTAETVAKRLIHLGLDTRVVYANVGHTFDPPLEDAVHGELAWLVQGDERWPSTP